MNFKKTVIFLILLSFIFGNTVFAGRKTKKIFKKLQKTISKVQKTKKQLVLEQAMEIDYQGGDYLGYSKFITKYLSEWHKITSNKKYPYKYWYRWRRRQINPIDLFSGGIAIRESLQLDGIRRFSKRNIKRPKETMVNLSELQSQTPMAKSHPFKEMLKNRKYTYSDLSKFAPNDFYYIHIASFTKALNLWDNLMRKAKPLYKRFSTSSVDYKIKDKVMLQLALKENKALRAFYDLVVKEAIIIGSDPFVLTGSDVTMIFNIKNIPLFKARIQKYRTEIKKQYKARVKKLKILGYKANYLFTKNRKVNSYYLKLDEKHFILSNSLEALKKVIKTYQNPKLSLYEADEFKYMRSIYKLNEKESIFLYMSDPFIRNLVSANIRLKESRRITIQFKLTKMQNLLMLYHQLYNKYPSSIQQMILKLAPKENTQEHYNYFMEFSKDLVLSRDKKTIKSLLYGNLGYFRANIDDTKFKFVTQEEAENYKNFVKNYNNYWKSYFDPIAIKISTQNNKILMDTHILPLINSSIYQMLKKMIGGKGVILNNKKLASEWLSISLKITKNLKKYLPKMHHELYREFKILKQKNIDFNNVIGDHITFSIMDSSPLVDFNVGSLITDTFTRRSSDIGIIAFFVSSLAHPVRISLSLKEGKTNVLKEEISYLINYLTKYPINRDITWRIYKKSYKSQEYTVVTLKFFEMITFRAYLMFTKDSLELTTTEKYLKNIVNSKPITSSITKKRNISLSFYPNSIKLEKEYFNNMLIDNLIKNNLKNIRTLSLIQSIYGKQLSKKEFYNMFNFNIIPPLNKEYIYKDHAITHPILFGYKFKTLDMKTLKKELLNTYYNLKKVQIDFEFTDTGIDTRITIE